MLLNEIVMGTAPVYHITRVSSALDILSNKRFKLAKATDPDLKTDPTDMYHMSVARSPRSGFFDLMAGPGSVMLVLNMNRIKALCKTTAYACPAAQDEMGDSFDEMEDRVYSKKPIMPIVGPLNNTVLEVRLQARAPVTTGGNAKFNQQQLDQLIQLCQQNNIPLKMYNPGDEKAFLLGR